MAKKRSSKLWAFFQSLGKSFMLPVALLSFMGLLLGLGESFSSPNTLKVMPFLDQEFLQYLFKFMAKIGSFAFSNLPILFAMAIPLGLAKYEKGVAAFSGFVGYTIMHLAINFYLTSANELATPELMRQSGQGMVMGIQTLEMGVLGGIIAGVVVYLLHERNYARKLPDLFAFFGGARFVPIITAVTLSIIGLLIPMIWPFFDAAITGVGNGIGKAGIFGPFLFGAGEMLLLPFGLHHILVAMIRFTAAGGEMLVNGEQVVGALNIFYAQLSDPATTEFSGEATRFLSQGKMPSMMFGLPGLALAIYHTAKMDKRSQIKGLLISGVIASVVAGITEPILFLFLFISPMLYGIHVVLFGLGFMVMSLLGVTIGNTDGNIIDFLVFGILQGTDTKWYMVLVVGVMWFALYYFVFKYFIVKFNLKTPGREDDEEEEDENEELTSAQKEIAAAVESTGKPLTTAERVLIALGGSSNIDTLDNCITRLRLVVKDMSLIDEKTLKKCGAIGVIKLDDHSLQVVVGPQVGVLKAAIEKIL